MNLDEYYMEKALKQALKAYKKGEVPVGAVIVYNDKIIGNGHNLKELKKDITQHAELIAIKKASCKVNDWRLENSIMYITLFPCPMCASAIVSSRIKKIVVGASTMDKTTKEIVYKILEGNNINPKVLIEENILQEKCKNLLSDFFKEQRK